MGNTNTILIVILVLAVIGGAGAYIYYRNKNMNKLFNDVYNSQMQVPPKKRISFLLLMFHESIASSKKKSKQPANMGKFNNPKYLEVQLLQMSTVLKDRSKVKNKTMKRSLQLLDAYLVWEKKQKTKKAS
ncbi:hypothetical protein KHM83_01340 [Fusibacter paucivorans]|uniref:Uncharacterized protein n=1 Tax=Fusibacter paucivorans TaxID=76009 RepID=A0ABS5PJQ7_9FIRM|nr:hypothetical protein [Fusibacter paucivorans]MBS7525314.1 hypothetical protein [Fusibacter paucivorans]